MPRTFGTMPACILFLLIQISLADDFQQTSCYEGVQSRKGNFWYVCRQGREVPVSCIAPDGRTQFAIGSTFRTTNFMLQCSQPSQFGIQMVPIACVSPQGHVISPGQLFTSDQTFFFRLQTQLAGCVGPHGELVPSGGLVNRAQFIYKCLTTANGIRLEAYACTYDGVQYSVGQDISTPAVWYRCEAEPDGGISIKLKGCVVNGRRYGVGEKYDDGNFVLQCTLDGNRIFPMGVGCVERFSNGTRIEYRINQRWVAELADRNRYLVECQKQGNLIKRAVIQCYYSLPPDGQGYLDGRCMRRVGRRLVQCWGGGGQNQQQAQPVTLTIQEPFNVGDEQRMIARGLRFC